MENVKKIGIMSDSHDNLPAIRSAIELFNNENYEINKLDLNRIYKFIDCIWCKEED